MKPLCIGCGKHPSDLAEYRDAVTEDIGAFDDEDDYVRREEGTYNPKNGHFLCTPCYIEAGAPGSLIAWVAP